MSAVRRFEGKVALVTGGSRGIGAAVVARLAEEGAKVFFTSRSEMPDTKAASAILCDSRDSSAVEAAVDGVVEKAGRLDVLVNNAGIIRDGLFLTMEDAEWSDVIDTNLGGTYRFCKAAAKVMMMQRAGRIVNVSSIVGELGGLGQANYAASKGAVNALTKSLAAEFASRGITVNAVAPGMVNTEMSSAVRSAFGDKIKERIPLGKFADPAEIAAAVAFLASDDAKYVTGQILTVDGGLSLLTRR